MAGPFAPGNESSCELSLPGTLVPRTFPPLIQNITMRYATYSRLMALPLLPAEHIQLAFNNNESSRERTFVPASERAGPSRSRERKFQGAIWPGSEWASERKGQGVKGPGSELARFVLADSLLGANGPGSEKSRYPSFLSIRLLGGCSLSGNRTFRNHETLTS